MQQLSGGCLCGAIRFTGDRGKTVHCRFRAECGSPIDTGVEATPALTFLKVGVPDDPSRLQRAIEIYCDSAQPWMPRLDTAQKFAKGPA
jgi:hypothetical protein